MNLWPDPDGNMTLWLGEQLEISEEEAGRSVPVFEEASLLLRDYRAKHEEFIAWDEWSADSLKEIQQASADVQCAILVLLYLLPFESLFRNGVWRLHQSLVEPTVLYADASLFLLARSLRKRTSPDPLLRFIQKRMGLGTLPASLLMALRDLWDIWGESRLNYHERERLGELIGIIEPGLMRPDEPWAEEALQTVNGLPEPQREAWRTLLKYAGTAKQNSSGDWKKEAQRLLETVGEESFRLTVEPWFVLFNNEQWSEMHGRNVFFLRGLLHFCELRTDAAMARSLCDVAIAGFRRGSPADYYTKPIGLICLQILKEMPGEEPIVQLARLRSQVRKRTVLTRLQKAYEQMAKRRGTKREDLEEALLPEVEIPPDGRLCQTFGEYTAEARFAQGALSPWSWSDSKGRTYKSVPKAVKELFKEAWDTFRKSCEEIVSLSAAQGQRLEGLLRVGHVWSLADWRERYLTHPVLLDLAGRLIWELHDGERIVSGFWDTERKGASGFVDVEGRPIGPLSAKARIQLWHPLTHSVDEVLQWRRWIETNAVTQPFPQAHREIYVLTDAERVTGAYSNRFANHVLAARRFGRLRSQHGWRFESDLTVPAAYQPYNEPQGHPLIKLALPQFKMRAEFWLEYVGEDDQRIALTEQVRFVDEKRAPVPLEQIPSIVFSEVMRDVDIFVNSTSIANDPEWQGRIEEAHRDLWQSVAFGELNNSASARRDILTRLLPRLPIAERCTLDDRFLVVRGDLRTYKIHLGSGNVLMEPNDHYLCIVPDRGGSQQADSRLSLPFEGDQTFALILSKAFLLVDDTQISDATILSQIMRGQAVSL
jgi:hypothetical protein